MSDKVKVRIALAVGRNGEWNSAGWGGPDSHATDSDKMSLAVEPLADGESRYWLEAEIEIPDPPTITAAVGADHA